MCDEINEFISKLKSQAKKNCQPDIISLLGNRRFESAKTIEREWARKNKGDFVELGTENQADLTEAKSF